jgi:hypothetical protein
MKRDTCGFLPTRNQKVLSRNRSWREDLMRRADPIRSCKPGNGHRQRTWAFPFDRLRTISVSGNPSDISELGVEPNA